MWIVRLALRRPYTFTVMAILVVLVGIVTIMRMSTDIFPNINIPVVSVIWSYPGVAQVTSICQTLLRIMPPGTTPPLIVQYSASNVPILQLGLRSLILILIGAVS